MEIKRLELLTPNRLEMIKFYHSILGFEITESEEGFSIFTKENELKFVNTNESNYYHFAFLIPTGALEGAIDFLQEKKIKLLPFKDKNIIQFQEGRSIYFYDPDQNIVEFIERPTLNHPKTTSFSIDSIIKLNEIGLPVEDPIAVSKRLMNEFGITVMDEKRLNPDFCWVGDFNGGLLVCPLERNWLPTKKPAIANQFVIEFEENGTSQRIQMPL